MSLRRIAAAAGGSPRPSSWWADLSVHPHRPQPVGEVSARQRAEVPQVTVCRGPVGAGARPVGEPRRPDDSPFDIGGYHDAFHRGHVGVDVPVQRANRIFDQQPVRERGIRGERQTRRGNASQAAYAGMAHRCDDAGHPPRIYGCTTPVGAAEAGQHGVVPRECRRPAFRIAYVALGDGEAAVTRERFGGAGDGGDPVSGVEGLAEKVGPGATGGAEHDQPHDVRRRPRTVRSAAAARIARVIKASNIWPCSPSTKVVSDLNSGS